MTFNTRAALSGAALISVCLIVAVICATSKPKILVVDSKKVFDGFRLTIETKAVASQKIAASARYIDSLSIRANLVSNQSEREALVNEIVERRAVIDQFNNNIIDTESKKIWERINTYTKAFAEKKGVYAIIGSQAMGDVLYHDQDLDATAELLAFINKQYEGVR